MSRKIFFRSFGFAAKFNSYGNPHNVLKLQTVNDAEYLIKDANEVIVKMLAAPINPSDKNFIEGVYGIKASFPAVAGSEGVGVVEKIGSKVSSLSVGDWVIPNESNLGTWTTKFICDEKRLVKIPNMIPIYYAATIAVNPCTAYRLLRDFVKLNPGDYIIQNGANSMVGMAVIQMARLMNIKTINIVRTDRPDVTRTLSLLSKLGGTINITDSYVNTVGFREILSEIPEIKLGLNCAGGDVVGDMARVISANGALVTYGNTAKRSFSLSPEMLAYKNLKFCGFWMQEWNSQNSLKSKTSMLNEISDMILKKKLTFFFKSHDFDDLAFAIESSNQPFSLRKHILNIDFPDRFKEHDMKDEDEYSIFDAPAN